LNIKPDGNAGQLLREAARFARTKIELANVKRQSDYPLQMTGKPRFRERGQLIPERRPKIFRKFLEVSSV